MQQDTSPPYHKVLQIFSLREKKLLIYPNCKQIVFKKMESKDIQLLGYILREKIRLIYNSLQVGKTFKI